jgi:hypothetical protein
VLFFWGNRVPDIQEWKELFKRRGTGVAVLGCLDSTGKKPVPRLVTEHALGFPEKNQPTGYASIFVRRPMGADVEHVLTNMAQHNYFSLNFLSFDQLDLAHALGKGDRSREVNWDVHLHAAPYMLDCNMALICEQSTIRKLDGSAYSLVTAKLVSFWENPEPKPALIFTQGKFAKADPETQVEADKNLVSKPGSTNPRL